MTESYGLETNTFQNLHTEGLAQAIMAFEYDEIDEIDDFYQLWAKLFSND